MRYAEKEKGVEVTIEEEVRVPGTDVILEKGDVIEIFEAKKKEADDEDDKEDDKEDDDKEDKKDEKK